MEDININMDEDELYCYLLEDIYNTLDKYSTTFNEYSGIKISKPDVQYDITKKTIWRNFRLICSQINREEDDIIKFLKKEYNTSISKNENGELLIKGKYTFQMIATTLKQYIKSYLQCSACKSIKTSIDKKNKLTYLLCCNKLCNYEKVIID